MKRSIGARTLAMPAPVWLVGTYDRDGRPNLMTASWAGICCSQPPCVAVSLRQATHSFAAIQARRAFTIGVPSQAQAREADFIGTASGAQVDKFAACAWTPVPSQAVDAPYAAEVPLVLECRLLHTLEIGLHTQFVGEIVDVKADPAVLDAEGRPDIRKVQPLAWDPAGQGYFGIGSPLGKAHDLGRDFGAGPQGGR